MSVDGSLGIRDTLAIHLKLLGYTVAWLVAVIVANAVFSGLIFSVIL